MSDVVIMPGLMMMTSIVSGEWLSRDTDTQTDIQSLASPILTFFKVESDFENKKE